MGNVARTGLQIKMEQSTGDVAQGEGAGFNLHHKIKPKRREWPRAEHWVQYLTGKDKVLGSQEGSRSTKEDYGRMPWPMVFLGPTHSWNFTLDLVSSAVHHHNESNVWL